MKQGHFFLTGFGVKHDKMKIGGHSHQQGIWKPSLQVVIGSQQFENADFCDRSAHFEFTQSCNPYSLCHELSAIKIQRSVAPLFRFFVRDRFEITNLSSGKVSYQAVSDSREGAKLVLCHKCEQECKC
jgi:hypothetical protein